MKKTILLPFFIMGFFSFLPLAHADTAFQIWDYTPTVSGTPPYAFSIGAISGTTTVPTPGELTLLGWDVRVQSISNPTDPLYFKYEDTAFVDPNSGTCYFVSAAFNPSVGAYTITLPTPQVIPAGAQPQYNAYKEPTCTTSSTARFSGRNPYAVGTQGLYVVWNFDGVPDSSTRVLRVNTPVLYSTTTSPVAVDFDYFQGEPAPATGYTLEFTKVLTGDFVSFHDIFSSGGSAGVFSASTTVALPSSGTWKLSVLLDNGSPDLPPGSDGSTLDRYDGTWFGVDYLDSAVQTVVFGPSAWPTYASTTCQISFAGTFDLGQCIGYITTPSPTALQSFGSLTLEHRFPFAYAYDIGRFREELFEAPHNGTTSIAVAVPNFGTITFLTESMISSVPFAGLIKTILGWVMWLLTAELIYLTIIRSHNKETGV